MKGPALAKNVKLSPKFQISIPKEVRAQLNWKAGQTLAVVAQGKGVYIGPIPTIEDLRGLFRGADTSDYRDRNDRY